MFGIAACCEGGPSLTQVGVGLSGLTAGYEFGCGVFSLFDCSHAAHPVAFRNYPCELSTLAQALSLNSKMPA